MYCIIYACSHTTNLHLYHMYYTTTHIIHSLTYTHAHTGEDQTPPWVTELLNSGMLLEVHKFSKFIHGCAVLLPDEVCISSVCSVYVVYIVL